MAHQVIRNYGDYKRFQKLDLAAHGLRRWRSWYSVSRPELAYQRCLRRVELARAYGGLGRPLYLALRIRLQILSNRTGISVLPGTCGPGLSIAHGGSVIVNGNARLGMFCRLQGAINIGVYKGAAPKLGDFVYVAPGAVVYGGVTVGDRSVLGANSVTAQDVPSFTVVVGKDRQLSGDSLAVMPMWMEDLAAKA